MLLSKLYKGDTEINKLYLGSSLVFDNTTTITLTPIMTNFRVEDATPTFVHFDTPLGSVAGIDYTNFSIYGKTIIAVNTTSNYFTLSSAITYWDNKKIKLEGGNGTVYDFTDERIWNNISVPSTSNVRYVEVGASGGGLTIGDPMSIASAMSAPENTTVHIKKGAYNYTGDSNLNHAVSGTATNPIIFKGYDVAPGDLDSYLIVDEFDYVNPATAAAQIDSTKWPVFSSDQSTQNASAFFTSAENYIIYQNIQAQKFDFNFWSYESSYIVWENCTSALAKYSTSSGAGFKSGTPVPNSNMRVQKCVSFDNFYDNVWLHGDAAAVLDCKVTAGVDGAGGSDYNIILLPATNSLVCNNEATILDTPTASVPHGIGIKQGNTDLTTDASSYNLIADNAIVQDMGDCLYIAHQGGSYNIIKRNSVIGIGSKANLKGTQVREGAHHNIFEQNYLEGMTDAINMYSSTENQPTGSGYLSDSNIFRNNIYNGCLNMVNMGDDSGNNLDVNANELYNNTFYNITGKMLAMSQSRTFTNNLLKNNIIVGDGGITLYSGFTDANTFAQTHNNYWNTGAATPGGTGNESVDPAFNSVVDGGFVPTVAFASIDAPQIASITTDNSGGERSNPTAKGAVKHGDELPVPDVTAPLYVSSVVEDASPSSLVITYNETLDATSVPATTDYAVSDGAANVVTNVAISGTDVTLTLTTPIDNGDIVTFSYTKGINPIQDADANESINLTSESVTNNVAPAVVDIFPQDNAAATSDDNSVGGWTTQNALIESSQVSPHDGLNAIRIYNGTGSFSQGYTVSMTLEIGATYRHTWWAKVNSYVEQKVRFQSGAWTTQTDVAITTTAWTEYTQDVVASATSGTVSCYTRTGGAGTSADELWIDLYTVVKL